MPEPLDARGTSACKISLMDSHGRAIAVNRSYSTTAVPNRILGQMLLSAFRYALSRQTCIVGETVEWMEAYWPSLKTWHSQIQEDIREAIERGRAGMECDVEEWQKILKLPTNY